MLFRSHQRGGAGPRRTARVESLNLANRLLVLVTCDRPTWAEWPAVVGTSLLKALEMTLTVPRALPGALRQLGGLGRAFTRRRELDARAALPARAVAARYVQPFRWAPWIAAWWRRIRGRAPGVAPRS